MGVLHQAVKTLTRTGASLGCKISSHVRATKRALFNWSQTAKANLKQRKEKGRKILKKVAQLATDSLKQSRQVLQALCASASQQSDKLTKNFGEQIKLAQTLLDQTQQKLHGQKSIADRIVSFYDPQARPIRKGKLNKAVEFGRTLQLVQDSSGVILHYEVHQGHPNDATQLVPLLHKANSDLGVKPTALSADRGYYSAPNVSALGEAGIKRVGIPKVGRLSRKEKRHQNSTWFRQLQRFRCGIEASISMLKRKFGLGRVLAKGSKATAVWTGLAIFSYNLWQQT